MRNRETSSRFAKNNGEIIVSGSDAVSRNVDVARKQITGATITQADWDALPLPDHSIDLYINLGRSILHSPTIQAMVACLKEARRVTRGKALVDRPAIKGHYEEAPQRFQSALAEHNIEARVEQGAVYDTPDNALSFKRLNAASDEQFAAICALAGFDAKIIDTHTFYYGPQENLNQYWELTPSQSTRTLEEALDLFSKAFTVKPMMTLASA